jgi:hypothetical protein
LNPVISASVSWSAGERKPTIDVAERVARALGRKLSTLIAEAERKSVKKI